MTGEQSCYKKQEQLLCELQDICESQHLISEKKIIDQHEQAAEKKPH